jgi:hypothetical protein
MPVLDLDLVAVLFLFLFLFLFLLTVTGLVIDTLFNLSPQCTCSVACRHQARTTHLEHLLGNRSARSPPPTLDPRPRPPSILLALHNAKPSIIATKPACPATTCATCSIRSASSTFMDA